MKRSLISEYSGGNLHSSIESKKVKVRKGSGNETSTSIVGGKKNNTKSLRSQNLDANSPSRKKVEKPSKTSVETPFNCSKKKTITPLKPKKRQRRKSKNMKMDVDLPEAARNEAPQLYVVVDTNVFLDGSELKAIDSLIEWFPLPGKPFRRAIVVVPWVVLQELDHLKTKTNCAQKARKAVAFLNQRFCAKKLGLRGQTILEAASIIDGLNIEVEDDRVLQCCFFFKNLPGNHKTLLFSKDSNLCNKAVVNQIDSFSNFALVVKHINYLNEGESPGFDKSFRAATARQQNDEVAGTQSNRPRLPKPAPHDRTAADTFPATQKLVHDSKCNHPPPACDTAKTLPPVNTAKVMTSLHASLQRSLGYILTREMIDVYGKEIWLDIVLKKPPWSLKDVFMCLKKHWMAVFSTNSNRIYEELIETGLQYLKTTRMSSITSSGIVDKRFINFVSCGLEVLKGLTEKKYMKEEIIQNSINEIRTSLTLLKSVESRKAQACIQPTNPQALARNVPDNVHKKRNSFPPLKNNSSSVSCANTLSSGDQNKRINADAFSSDEDVVFEDLDDGNDGRVSEADSLSFWESLDQIWTSIIGHCASIFKSLEYRVESAPNELHSMLAGTSITNLPHPSVALSVIPLLLELIDGFLSALEKFLSSFETSQSLSDPSICYDLLQSLWTITKAFNMPSKIENARPSTILQSCLMTENRAKLINGFSKLNQVSVLLKECANRFIQIS